MFKRASKFNQDLCSWDTTMVWTAADIFEDTKCPYCDRRDRRLHFLPESSNDERYNKDEERRTLYEEGGNERKNHKRRARQEKGDIIPPSPLDTDVGVIEGTDGPAALQTAGGASPSFGFVGTVIGLVGAVLLA